MRRRLLQLLTALSLLLALATAGLWGRSYWQSDFIWHESVNYSNEDRSTGTQRMIATISLDGCLQLHCFVDRFSGISAEQFIERPTHGWNYADGTGAPDEWPTAAEFYSLDSPENVAGFSVEFDENTWGYTVHWSRTKFQCPHWFLVLLFSLLPAVRVIRWQLRRRRARQLGPDARPCPSCGYDRRATPTRCPECGHL